MKIKFKAIQLLSCIGFAPIATLASTSLTSCGLITKNKEAVVDKHLAKFDFELSGISNIDDWWISDYDKDALSLNSFEYGLPYHLTMSVLKQPDGKTYPFTFNYTLKDAFKSKRKATFYVVNTGNANSFEQDRWDTLISIANQGVQALKDHYGDSFKIGAERGVIVNNLAHRVRLIGIEEDTYGDNNTKAPLTFEFVNVISTRDDSPKDYVKYLTWSSNNYDFTTSNYSLLHQLQDNEGAVVKLLPDYLTTDNAIKMTNRRALTCSNNEWKSYQVVDYKSKLFLPCVSDIFSEKGIQKMSGDTVFDHNLGYYKAELPDCRKYESEASKTQYSYFKENIGDDIAGQSGGGGWHKALIKHSVLRGGTDTDINGYWLGSPFVSKVGYMEYNLNHAWKISWHNTVSYQKADLTQELWEADQKDSAIAPLFCI